METLEAKGGPFGDNYYGRDPSDKHYYHAELLAKSGYIVKKDSTYTMLTMAGHDLRLQPPRAKATREHRNVFSGQCDEHNDVNNLQTMQTASGAGTAASLQVRSSHK